MVTYIYKIINLINGKLYIGKTCAINPNSRWQKHLSIAKNKTTSNNSYQLIHKSINKYGQENFKFEIIEECSDNILGSEREKYYIILYKTNVYIYGNKYGYNLTCGGDGSNGFRHSIESRKKMSENRRGKKMGNENSFYGKHHSDETKDKLKSKNTGVKQPLSAVLKRCKLTVEQVLFIRSEISNCINKKEQVIKCQKLMAQFNISYANIRLIITRKRWGTI